MFLKQVAVHQLLNKWVLVHCTISVVTRSCVITSHAMDLLKIGLVLRIIYRSKFIYSHNLKTPK